MFLATLREKLPGGVVMYLNASGARTTGTMSRDHLKNRLFSPIVQDKFVLVDPKGAGSNSAFKIRL